MKNILILYIMSIFTIETSCSGQSINFGYDINKNMVSKTKNSYGEHIVQNTNDNGLSSLRWIIMDACPEDTVTFATNLLGDTITLTGPEIIIDRSLYILGLHQDSLTISGEDNSRIFNVQKDIIVGFEGMKLIRGYNQSEGGVILNKSQDLVLKNMVLEKNKESTTNKALTNKGHIKVEGTVIIRD